MYIVGFNGPPRSGKDTAAQMFLEHLDGRVTIPSCMRSLSTPMRNRAFGALCLPYNGEHYEQIKDQPLSQLGGMTLRQFMIADSEEFMKPKFGKDIWNQLLCESLAGIPSALVVIPDFGFQHEPDFMMARYSPNRVVMVQISRDGRTFASDSRTYVTADRNMAIENNGTLGDLHTEVVRLYGRLVNQLGWKL
jgi:hypothetical protein